MYIECQQCNTTFRLDENLLKPAGSKVRCSQCGNIFMALPPPAPTQEPFLPLDEPTPAPAPADEAPPQPSQAVEDQDKDVGLEDIDLAELDTFFAQGQKPSAEAPAAEQSTAQEEAEDVQVESDLDDADLEIDFDAALEEDNGVAEAPSVEASAGAPESASDDLDLELDFNLDDDSVEAIAVDQTPAQAAEIDSDDLDLELDFNLDEDSAEPIAVDQAPAQAAEIDSDDLDLELDFDLDEAVAEPAVEDQPPVQGKTGEVGENEFELDLDQVNLEADSDLTVFDDLSSISADEDDEATVLAQPLSAAAVSGLQSQTSGGDLSADDDIFGDLDSILEESIAEAADEVEARPDEELELDLAADETEEQNQGGDDELEDLSFQLDAEYEDKPIAQAEASAPAQADEEEEIDLSEIERMLEGVDAQGSSEEVAEQTSGGDDFDLGLDDEIDLDELEAAIDLAGTMAMDDTATVREGELEFDLPLSEDKAQATGAQDLNLDQDLARKPVDEESGDLDLDLDDLDDLGEDQDLDLDLEIEGDLDLDLEMESEPKPTASQSFAAEEEQADELDLSDLDDLVMAGKPATQSEIIDGGDIELEFQIEGESETGQSKVQEHLDTLTPGTTPSMFQALGTTDLEEEDLEPQKPARKQKEKTSPLLLVLLILVLLGAIGYGLYYAVTEMGIQIPYVSDYLPIKSKDPTGTLQLTTSDINSKFITNEQSGRLFVITGKVHNGYGNNRGQIRLQGKLFTKGKVLAQAQSVYAGNTFDDQALRSMPFIEIKKQLGTAPAAGALGSAIGPNQSIDFMVVFSNLPNVDELDEFAVEVVKSDPVQ